MRADRDTALGGARSSCARHRSSGPLFGRNGLDHGV